MSKPVVVGLLGRAGSGKSTAAKHLKSIYQAQSFSFAAPLKELAKDLWQFTDEQVYGTQAQKETVDPRYGISPRVAMIRLGDGARNRIHKRVWVDGVISGILDSHKKREEESRPFATTSVRCYDFYIVEDVRYPNEAEAISTDPRLDGFVVKLVCPDSDSSSAYANASSEKSVDEVPLFLLFAQIISRKSPDSTDLKRKIDEVMLSLIKNLDDRYTDDRDPHP